MPFEEKKTIYFTFFHLFFILFPFISTSLKAVCVSTRTYACVSLSIHTNTYFMHVYKRIYIQLYSGRNSDPCARAKTHTQTQMYVYMVVFMCGGVRFMHISLYIRQPCYNDICGCVYILSVCQYNNIYFINNSLYEQIKSLLCMRTR